MTGVQTCALPIFLGFLGGYHGETTITAALGAEENEISAGLRALVPGFAHVPYPNPYRSPFAPPRPGGSGDRRRLVARTAVHDNRLHGRAATLARDPLEAAADAGSLVARPDDHADIDSGHVGILPLR